MQIKTDFLVIGSGVAGLMFALKVAQFGEVARILNLLKKGFLIFMKNV